MLVRNFCGMGLCFVAAALLQLAGCRREAPPPPPPKKAPVSNVVPAAVENGAISMAPVAPESARAGSGKKNARTAAIDWSFVMLEPGQAWLGCELDYAHQGEGEALIDLDRDTLTKRLRECVGRGVLRLRYHGRITAEFAALVERVARVADTLKIGKRVLDINSTGGQVEDAIRAGDVIAETRWTIWVREDSICHSACVFILAAGDVRRIAGKVGIHRIIRMSSTATTRAELNAELRLVYDRVRDYLERNGASLVLADLMRAVPNRSLRLLSSDELLRFGLDGVNPAQDDLDRLRLQRECGEDFLSRRDAFARAFDNQCRASANEVEELNACGLSLRRKFGFPDSGCPAESPLSEFDLGQAEPAPEAKPQTAPDAKGPSAANEPPAAKTPEQGEGKADSPQPPGAMP